MLVTYTLECGHAYDHFKHVKLKDNSLYCRRCKAYKKVTHIGETHSLSPFLKKKAKS